MFHKTSIHSNLATQFPILIHCVFSEKFWKAKSDSSFREFRKLRHNLNYNWCKKKSTILIWKKFFINVYDSFCPKGSSTHGDWTRILKVQSQHHIFLCVLNKRINSFVFFFVQKWYKIFDMIIFSNIFIVL